jgi:catechol 2,3-dioxygenase-like lactoylglutathione lyase family enzyme
MGVRSITWAARSVDDGDVEAMAGFAQALGLASLLTTSDSAMFAAEDGGVVEFCGPSYPAPEHLFAAQDTVIGFEVDDLDETVRKLGDAGVELVGDRGAAGAVIFQHVRGPDGRIYGLIATPETEAGS